MRKSGNVAADLVPGAVLAAAPVALLGAVVLAVHVARTSRDASVLLLPPASDSGPVLLVLGSVQLGTFVFVMKAMPVKEATAAPVEMMLVEYVAALSLLRFSMFPEPTLSIELFQR